MNTDEPVEHFRDSITPQNRLFELVLVMMIAFFYPVAYTFGLLFRVSFMDWVALGYGPGDYLTSTIYDITVLCLVAYLLYRRKESFATLGLKFNWDSLLQSFGVCVVGYGGFLLASYFRETYGILPAPDVPLFAAWFQERISVFGIIAHISYPIFQEIIARGFLQTELEELRQAPFVIICSGVLLQFLVYASNGIGSALVQVPMFLVFAIYYYKTGKLTPVVLAHLYFSLYSYLVK